MAALSNAGWWVRRYQSRIPSANGDAKGSTVLTAAERGSVSRPVQHYYTRWIASSNRVRSPRSSSSFCSTERTPSIMTTSSSPVQQRAAVASSRILLSCVLSIAGRTI